MVRTSSKISKHRMLLFINYCKFHPRSLYHFKTSYVTVYRHMPGLYLILFLHFKTSYVTVYQRQFKGSYYNGCISKHRMLLFIPLRLGCESVGVGFQNIVCYCLSFWLQPCHLRIIISKHRMLLFIIIIHLCYFKVRFISKHRMLLFIPRDPALLKLRTKNFKTSYVTVYRNEHHWIKKRFLFQNIVCYCLSPDSAGGNTS